MKYQNAILKNRMILLRGLIMSKFYSFESKYKLNNQQQTVADKFFDLYVREVAYNGNRKITNNLVKTCNDRCNQWLIESHGLELNELLTVNGFYSMKTTYIIFKMIGAELNK
jgi:hypothetical protein